jgi:hypothetical protein
MNMGAMLLLGALLVSGVTGCDDQLLPPPAPESQPEREVLVYINDYGVIGTADELDLSRSTIVAKRADGTGSRPITVGLISSSPQNGRMAFYYADSMGVLPTGIYIAGDDGSSPTLFEPDGVTGKISMNPWSVQLGPDGRSVAWVAADEFGYAQLVVRTPDHRWEIPLDVSVDNPLDLSVPRFSPDGVYVAYAKASYDMFDAAGSIKLVQTSTGIVRDIDARIMPSLSGAVAPPFDWAPDSRRILYAGIVLDDQYVFSSEPMVTNIATGLTDTLMRDGMVKESPRWLPGGNQILYVGLSENSGADLFLRDNSGQVRRLTYDESTYKIGVSISPDGRTALYTEFANFDQELGIVRSFDLVRRTAGPVLATDTDMGHWRQ